MSSIRAKWSAGLVRALPLEERLVLLGVAGRAGGRRNARSRQRIERWKAKKPFAKGDAFARRLRQLDLDENRLLRALDLGATREVRRHVGDHRLWKTFTRLTARRDNGESGPSLEGHRALLHLVRPLLDDALAALDSALAARAADDEGVFDIEAIRACASEDLVANLLQIIERVCLLDLNILRLQGRLSGRDRRARYDSYIRMLRGGAHARRVFAEYPVLLEVLPTRIAHWQAHVFEVLAAWQGDRAQVVAQILDGADPGRLVAWSGQLGDSHRGGRAVTTLEFESGHKVVYKPRPLDVDAGFNTLVAWCNRMLPEQPLRTARVLPCGEHGWSEFVRRDALAVRADAHAYYHRQGKFLALFHALHAGDLHCDNLIASGADPVYIDLETLFHAQVVQSLCVAGSQPPPSSITDTLMLSPMRMSGASNGEREHCALAFEADRRESLPAWRVQNAATDEAAMARATLSAPAPAHFPHHEGKDIALDGHADDVRAGFVAMYRMLMQAKDELLALLLACFDGVTVRHVMRPTRLYVEFMRNSLHPHHLRDAVERRALLERLFEAQAAAGWLNHLLASEIRDLEALDVPYFSRKFGETRVRDSRGGVVGQLEFASPRDTVIAQVAGLDAADLKAQLEVLDFSLGCGERRDVIGAAQPPRRVASEDMTPVDAAGAAERALAIADMISECAIVRGEQRYWLCQAAAVDTPAMTISPGFPSLYGGQLGIALFLGTVGAWNRSAEHVALARAALRTVGGWTGDGRVGLPGLGVFTGVLGYPYVMAALACQLDDRSLLQESLAWFERFDPAQFNDEIDVIGGSAGGILFLHALIGVARRHGEPVARLHECIAAFADAILAQRVEQPVGVGWLPPLQNDGPPLAGFAHGNAGIAAALYVAAQVLDRPDCRRLAHEAIRYENTLYVPATGNWQDLRKASTLSEADHRMSTWCHGATGVLLGRALCAAFAPRDDAFADVLRRDIGRAERTSLQARQTNDSLCHGSFGNHDVHQFVRALPLGDALTLSAPSIDAMAWSPAVLRDLRCGDSEQTPLDGRFASPDLMCGLAGVGYGLLRYAAPTRVPSVLGLALEP